MKIIQGGSKQGEIIHGNNIVFFGVCLCVLYRHPSIEGGNKISSKGKKWDFK